MKFKLMLILTLIMFSVSAVSASNIDNVSAHDDVNGDFTDIKVEEPIREGPLYHNNDSYDLQNLIDRNVSVQDVDADVSGIHVLREDIVKDSFILNDAGSFAELQRLIDSKDVIYLTKDYSAGFMDNSIIINSAKTIYGNGHTISGSQLTRIFTIAGGMNVVINDVVLKDGAAVNGGAISAYGNVNGLTFNNVEFWNNYASDSGGAVFIDADNLAIKTRFTNCHFEGNVAENLFGGAVYYRSCAPLVVTNCNFFTNKANGDSNGFGGAIFTRSLTEINKCKFSVNTADQYGGAIYAGYDLAVANCDFYENHAWINDGGAIFAMQALNVYDCKFLSNTAYEDGGAICSAAPYEYNTLLVRSVFNGNSAKGSNERCYGGAVRSETTVIVEDCEFNNNYAEDRGGAIYADSDIQFRGGENSFIGNIAENYGGAVYTGTILGNVEYVIFKNNQAKTDHGGAIYIDDEYDGTFAHCIFESNYARSRGGAICVNDMSSDVTLTRNAFINNIASYGMSGYTANRGSITDLWGDEAFILGPNWYGDTTEESRQGQFYRSSLVSIVPGDCVEVRVNSWLDSMWEIFDD